MAALLLDPDEGLNRQPKVTPATTKPVRAETDVSGVLHHQLLKELELNCSFFEHTLTLEQLSDLHPLSRICLENPELSKGLNKDEAAGRLAADGHNVVYPISGRTAMQTFLKQFTNTFRLMLLIAALTCFIIYALDTDRYIELYLAITLVVLFFVLCAVSYWQERTAKKNMRGFQSMIPPYCFAVRAAERIRISAADIVVGDIVYLCPGARVPADVRLIYTDELKLDTSWITGELEPLDFSDATAPKNVSALAAQNIALNGCLCSRGTAYGVVIRVGNRTVIGKIVQMTSKERGVPTRLELEHKRFVCFITVLALTMGLITFIVGLLLSNFHRVVNTFVNGFLVIVIANIPQGLPITLGAALIIVARRLAKRNVFMKRLDVVETLGTATVVMCDKTGIFTLNDVTITDLWHQLRGFTGTEQLRQQQRDLSSELEVPLSEGNGSSLVALLTVMSVCNKAHLEPITLASASLWSKLAASVSEAANNMTIRSLLDGTSGQKISDGDVQRTVRAAFHHKLVTGNANEVALLKYVEEIANVQRIRNNYEVLFELPFNRQRRFQMMFVRERGRNRSSDNGDMKLYVLVKGAPEELLAYCTSIATEQGTLPMSEDFIAQFSETYNKYGSEGKSCMAFAMAKFDEHNYNESFGNWEEFSRLGLCFLGMVAMYDPPRSTVFKALSTLRSAGVKCFMVTGDHPSTAAAIARHFGLIVSRPFDTSLDMEMEKDQQNLLSVIHCETLSGLSDQKWDDILKQRAVVFARATPSHKLIIVKECRRRGEVVAVTGDGVFDAPALKEANVGIAMDAVATISGSAFAKEAADMVFNESDVKHIVEGIEEGRLLYANLKKTIAYTLAHMVPELCAVMLTLAIGFPLGLSSVQVLSIDLITEMPPSIALTYEAGEKDIMRRPPRKNTSRLVSRALLVYSYIFVGSIISAGCFIAYSSVFWHYEIPLRQLLHSNTNHWHLNSEPLITSSGKLYTPEMQIAIHGQAQAAWHITLVMSQVFHFWLCTTRRISIFEHGIHNIVAVCAVLLEICLLNFMIYTPGVQRWLGVTHPPAFVWLFCLPVGILLIVFNEIRKWFIRRYPNSNIVRAFKW